MTYLDTPDVEESSTAHMNNTCDKYKLKVSYFSIWQGFSEHQVNLV